jgi:hypothetical protein
MPKIPFPLRCLLLILWRKIEQSIVIKLTDLHQLPWVVGLNGSSHMPLNFPAVDLMTATVLATLLARWPTYPLIRLAQPL